MTETERTVNMSETETDVHAAIAARPNDSSARIASAADANDSTAMNGAQPAPLTLADLQQDPAVYTFPARIRYSEVDHNAQLTLPALVNYFQDCSTFQSEDLGVGMQWLKDQQKAWVLSHWRVIVDRYPMLNETVTVGTFAIRFKGLMAYRNFFMADESGTIVAKADTTWIFMDLAKARPVKATAEHVDPYGTHEPLPMPPDPSRKIKLPADMEEREPFAVRRSMIDTNEHVNNCQYLQMAMEMLPREAAVRTARIDFRRAAVMGDVIHPFMAQEEGRTVVELRDAEGAPFVAVEMQ